MTIERLKNVVAAAALGATALVGMAVASHTAAPGVIHGCNPPPIGTSPGTGQPNVGDPQICRPIEG